VNHFFKIISVLVIFFSAVFAEQGNCMAQKNLVPNWSFEEYNSCPDANTSDCHISAPTIPSLKNWFCFFTVVATPDYFNSCGILNLSTPNNFSGTQIPKTGSAYMGGILWSRGYFHSENIEIKLIDSLKKNVNYCVTYYVSRGESRSDYAISNFGAYLSNSKIQPGGYPLTWLSPQIKNPKTNYITDRDNWSVISGTFTATNYEKYLSLGNFDELNVIDTLYVPQLPIDPDRRYDNLYYYFDDVSVEEVLNADAGSNQTIACGDSVRIGLDSAWAANYTWEPSTGLVNAKVPMPIAHPTITTTYTVTKQQCEVITTSTVTVFVTNTCPYINYLDEFMIPNVFTPNGDNSNDVWQFTLGLGNNLKSLHIYDRWGLEVKSSQMQTQNFIKWDGYTTTGEPCTAGVYFYTLEYSNVLGEQNKVNGYITLMK
jgi:gliding motility-associated-like protein